MLFPSYLFVAVGAEIGVVLVIFSAIGTELRALRGLKPFLEIRAGYKPQGEKQRKNQ